MKSIKNTRVFNPYDFIKALTINERYNILKRSGEKFELDTEALSKWQSRTTLVDQDLFMETLELQGYDVVTYSNALRLYLDKYKGDLVKSVIHQDWFNELNKIFLKCFENESNYDVKSGYRYLLRPFLEYAKSELAHALKKYNIKFDSCIFSLEEGLVSQLVLIASKTFVLELNVSKLRDELKGETSKARFYSFIRDKGSKKNLIDLYREYSVLARTLLEQTQRYVNVAKELLGRLFKDIDEIITTFQLNHDVLLEKIHFGAGDTHQNGRTVAILTFSDNKKIMYKPKRLQILNPFNKLIHRINDEPNILELKTVKSLIYDEYGYQEFIEQKSCNTKQEVQNYYQRFGQLLGITYMINGSDFHMENLIASGEHPYIVDIETLFQNVIPLDVEQNADFIGNLTLLNNVNYTHLLPQPTYQDIFGENIDLSALGGFNQVSPRKDYQLTNELTDEMRYELKNLVIPESNNRVFLNGEPLNYKDYIDYLLIGFENVCKFFLKNKKELLQQDGIISNFNNMTIRTILRNTKNYGDTLFSTYHPDYTRDYYYLEQVLENIWALQVTDKRLIISEYNDLMRGDIPIFFTKTSSISLFDSEGNEFRDIFKESGINRVRKKLKTLQMQIFRDRFL